MNGSSGILCSFMECFGKNTTNRISEAYVSDNSVTEECTLPATCTIQELVGNDNILLMFGVSLWISYGIHLGDMIIIVANSAAASFSALILILRYKYIRQK